MTTTKREARIAELDAMMQEWGWNRNEMSLLDILYEYYETAGVERERLDAEFGPMSDDELIEAYLNI